MTLRALAALAIVLAACDGQRPASPVKIPVSVDRVILGENLTPAVVLEEDGGPRVLHIWIGLNEAHSIAARLAEQSSLRPNTHDLAKRMLEGLDAEVAEITVNDLRSGVYFAILKISRRGRTVEIDSRPSDAIAIALRTGAPIYVHAELFDAADGDREEGTEGPGREVRSDALERFAGETPSPPSIRVIPRSATGSLGATRAVNL